MKSIPAGALMHNPGRGVFVVWDANESPGSSANWLETLLSSRLYRRYEASQKDLSAFNTDNFCRAQGYLASTRIMSLNAVTNPVASCFASRRSQSWRLL